MFLDMFEHEYNEINVRAALHRCRCEDVNPDFVPQSHQMHHQRETVLRDWSILLPPTSTPLSGIELTRRFPCGDTERLKQSMRVFFLLRALCLSLGGEAESQLPLTKQEHLVKENNALDLS